MDKSDDCSANHTMPTATQMLLHTINIDKR